MMYDSGNQLQESFSSGQVFSNLQVKKNNDVINDVNFLYHYRVCRKITERAVDTFSDVYNENELNADTYTK